MSKPQPVATVPPAILTAVVGLLLPFIPTITPTELEDALKHLNKPKKSEIEKPLTRKQPASLLGISMPTLQRWQNAGKVHPIKISRRCVRISAASVRELLES